MERFIFDPVISAVGFVRLFFPLLSNVELIAHFEYFSMFTSVFPVQWLTNYFRRTIFRLLVYRNLKQKSATFLNAKQFFTKYDLPSEKSLLEIISSAFRVSYFAALCLDKSELFGSLAMMVDGKFKRHKWPKGFSFVRQKMNNQQMRKKCKCSMWQRAVSVEWESLGSKEVRYWAIN